jgi:hypothetical protein
MPVWFVKWYQWSDRAADTNLALISHLTKRSV